VRESIRHLYTLFDKVFPRPISFHNEYCCVGPEQERPLLTLPREQLTEIILAHPVSHCGSCFGTFEEVSYFIPRLFELLDDSVEGFQYGGLDISFFWLLADHESEYRAVQLWESIESAMRDIFIAHTSAFTIEHHGSLDHVVGSGLVDEMLDGFFFRVLPKRNAPSAVRGNDGKAFTEWDDFFARWASDENPHRLAHLLDVIRRYWIGMMFDQYRPPASIIEQFMRPEFAQRVLQAAMPAILGADSSTWLNDLLQCLPVDAGSAE
jgi:hypothetical protein